MPCEYCGRSFTLHPPEARRTRDHAFPKSRFYLPMGESERKTGNLIDACYGCNQDKNDWTPEEWAWVLAHRTMNADPRLPRIRAIAARLEPLKRIIRSRTDHIRIRQV